MAGSWDAWRTAPASARAAQRYVDDTVAYGKILASSEDARNALSPSALWSHVRTVLDAWTSFEAQVDPQRREERARWADVARATLGLLRNSAVESQHAQMMGYAHATYAARTVATSNGGCRHSSCLSACRILYVCRMSSHTVLVPIRVLAQCLVNSVTSAPETRTTLWATHVIAEESAPWADALLYVVPLT